MLAGLGAVAFSGKAVIVKLAYRYGVDAVTLLMYRMLFALPIFLVMAWWASRGQPRLSARDWRGIVGWACAATTSPASWISLGWLTSRRVWSA